MAAKFHAREDCDSFGALEEIADSVNLCTECQMLE